MEKTTRYYYLIDFGTGSTRTVLADSTGMILAMRTFNNEYYVDSSYEDAQYFIPKDWESNILNGLQSLADDYPNVHPCAVSAAGARQSFVLLGKDGEGVYGLPNIDNRGREYMDDIHNREELYRISGKWVTEDFGAAKIMGFRKKYPKKMAEVSSFTSLSEWMAQIFTGKTVIEPSQACESALYDLERRSWSDTVCEEYGIEHSILPQIVNSGTSTGTISRELIERFHMAEDAVFLIGGADTQLALKSGNTRPGEIAVVSGTTSPVAVLMEDKFYDPEQQVWTDSYLSGTSYMVEMNPGVTGLNYQRIKDKLFPQYTYEELEQEYGKKTSFGCTASFTSLLFQKQKSLKHGGFFMSSPVSPAFNPTDMIWAVLADIACATYEQFRLLRGLTGNQADTVRGFGGGFRSAALCQMEADLFGMPLKLSAGYEQATAYGLIVLCNEHFGIIDEAEEESSHIFQPQNDSLIQSYYPIWKANREHANS